MDVGRYHRFLRVSAVVTAFVLVFDGGFLFPVTKEFSEITYEHLANVSSGTGLFASVPENEINMYTAELSERQRELDAREAALREREIASRSYAGGDAPDYSVYIISIILFILTVLITLNYAMDFVRARTVRYEKRMG